MLALAAIMAVALAAVASGDPPGPTASFDVDPASTVAAGQLITFTSTSVAGDGHTLVSEDWELDGDDDFDDASGPITSLTAGSPGSLTIKLRVTDDHGDTSTAIEVIDILNQAPTASFTVDPSSPLTNETVTFTSDSSDPDGSIASEDWELDGDDDFDDASGGGATTSFGAAGTYTIKLRVTDNDGSPNETSRSVTVRNRAPSASISANPDSPLTNETVDFTGTSSDPDGSIVAEDWELDGDDDFNDASGGSASRSFATPGPYTVKLRVTDNDGETAFASKTVEVGNRGPTAGIDASDTSPLSGEEVTFTSNSSDPDGTIVTHAWDLDGQDDDFNEAFGTTAKQTFSTPGTKTVKLKVIDSDGGSNTATIQISVRNRAPSASFQISNPAPLSAVNVTFTSTSSDPDGTISHAWDIDGDGYDDGSAATLVKSFATPGQKTIKLRVTDDSGAQAVAQETINVGNRLPHAAFDYSPLTPLKNTPVNFQSTSSDPENAISTLEWDFQGDGVYDATGASPSHSFATTGPHTVRLRVTDAHGGVATAERTLTMGNRSPTASFNASSLTPLSLVPVTFTSTSTDLDGTLQLQQWSFGDGTTATGPVVDHAYARPGTYTVLLTVVDDNTASHVATKTIVVGNRLPDATYTVSPAAPTTLETVTFTSTSIDPDGPITGQVWDFDGDGFDDGSAKTVTRTFPTPGSRTIRLRVTDSTGATDTESRTIAIANRPPVASFSHTPLSPAAFRDVTFTSESLDPDGSIATYGWDLDNDGAYDDGSGSTAKRQFRAPGTYVVRLRVTDGEPGGSAIATGTVTVGNEPPQSGFSYAPGSPTAGASVSFFSTATDPDSPIREQAWDLDGDGSFDDASGPTASRVFAGPGSYTVSLRVIDAEEEWSIASRTVVVSAPPPPAALVGAQAAAPGLPLLSPFPIVRISGTIGRWGTRLRRLTVATPPGAKVTVRCKGRGCPFGRQSRTVGSVNKSQTARIVRIRKFERKLLRAGATVKVFVTKQGLIGKYTRFKFRKRKAPARTDGCLMPGQVSPVECPS